MRGAAGGRPPPIFDSWNAVWTRRAASAAWSAVTANEMFRSDDPCAIATTLMPPVASAENTRAAMPGAAGHAVADDGDHRHAGRAVTLSIRPLDSSSRNARRTLRTARRPSDFGAA